jgi:hypothetical protein
MPYEPKLPDDVKLPPGHSIDTGSGRYRELHDLAERGKFSQAAFSDLLGIEARRVSAEHERARASQPAPAQPASRSWDKLSTQEKFAHALSRSVVNRLT